MPASINEESRTVDLVFTTGAMVRRFDWMEGEYEEELEVSESAIRMERLNSGAPLLADHAWYDLEKQHGVVERGWIENGEGKVTVRFAKDEKSETIWQKVKDKIIRNVSVGYNVHSYMEIIEEGKRRILRAIDWEPLEISLVAVGADAKAGIRAEETIHPCVIKRAATPNGETKMDPKNENGATTPEATPAAPAAPAETTETAAPATSEVASERALEIMELCTLSNQNLARAVELVKGNKSVAEVRAMLINERAANSTEEISSQVKPQAEVKTGGMAARMAKNFKKS